MEEALTVKLQRHLGQMLPRKEQLSHAEREHFVRHLKGVLSTIGEWIEQEMRKTTT